MPDTRQLLLQVLEAPAELGGPGTGLLLPGAQAETPHTGRPSATAPEDNEPSKPSGNTKDTSGLQLLFLCHQNGQIYLSATVSNGCKKNEEMQRWAVGQIKLEPTENFPLHPQQLVLRICVVHQVAKSRHLKKKKNPRQNHPCNIKVTVYN